MESYGLVIKERNEEAKKSYFSKLMLIRIVHTTYVNREAEPNDLEHDIIMEEKNLTVTCAINSGRINFLKLINLIFFTH